MAETLRDKLLSVDSDPTNKAAISSNDPTLAPASAPAPNPTDDIRYLPGTSVQSTPGAGSNSFPVPLNVSQSGSSNVTGLPVSYPATNSTPVTTAPGAPGAPHAVHVLPPNAGTSFDQNAANVIGGTQQGQSLAQQKADLESEHQQKVASLQGALADSDQKKLDDEQHFADQSMRAHQVDSKTLAKRANDISGQTTDDKGVPLGPDHWWNSKTTGGKIESVIGLLLGGIGQGMAAFGPHGNKNARNYAADAMDQAIKDDIDSQDKNRRNQWEGYRAQHDLADNNDNYSKFILQHKQNQFVMGQEVAKNRLAQLTAQAADPQAQVAGKQAVLDLQAKIDSEKRDMGFHAEQLAAGANASQVTAIKDQKKDLDQFGKDWLDYKKTHPGISDYEAQRAVGATNPRYVQFTEEGKLRKLKIGLIGHMNPTTGRPYVDGQEVENTVRARPDLFPDVTVNREPGVTGVPEKAPEKTDTEETTTVAEPGKPAKTTTVKKTTNATPQPVPAKGSPAPKNATPSSGVPQYYPPGTYPQGKIPLAPK